MGSTSILVKRGLGQDDLFHYPTQILLNEHRLPCFYIDIHTFICTLIDE
jgi:hypothetical protein